MNNNVWLSLGSNQGDSISLMKKATLLLDANPQCRLIQSSSFYQTAPIGCQGNDFVNAALWITTTMQPETLLSLIHRIEKELGRVRLYTNSPRTIDIDILYFGDLQHQTTTLTIPHPEIKNRAFVLFPLMELNCPYISQTDLQSVESQEIRKIKPGEQNRESING